MQRKNKINARTPKIPAKRAVLVKVVPSLSEKNSVLGFCKIL